MKLKVHRIPLDDRLDHDLYQMDARINSATRLVYVCNPNNPTSNLADDKALRDFVSNAAKRAPVIVDEAYIDFVDVPGHKSMVDLVLKGESVVVTRTASKMHGLAGMRVGFAIARPDILKKIGQYVSGDPNVFGLHAANASLQDQEYQAFVKQRNTAGRTMLIDTLTKLGKKVAASQTNFVFFQAGKPVAEMQKYFTAKGFTIGRAFLPYSDWCRVSVGTPEEMTQFCAAVPGAFA
jgi:histidinol-phosphate aminotransferase